MSTLCPGLTPCNKPVSLHLKQDLRLISNTSCIFTKTVLTFWIIQTVSREFIDRELHISQCQMKKLSVWDWCCSMPGLSMNREHQRCFLSNVGLDDVTFQLMLQYLEAISQDMIHIMYFDILNSHKHTRAGRQSSGNQINLLYTKTNTHAISQ